MANIRIIHKQYSLEAGLFSKPLKPLTLSLMIGWQVGLKPENPVPKGSVPNGSKRKEVKQ